MIFPAVVEVPRNDTEATSNSSSKEGPGTENGGFIIWYKLMADAKPTSQLRQIITMARYFFSIWTSSFAEFPKNVRGSSIFKSYESRHLFLGQDIISIIEIKS
jgi:hypothetical protein